MKFALVIPDGCADQPQAELGGKTPLEAAHIPHMDEIVRRGVVGRANNTPPALPSGSDVATMSLFGYDPLQFHTGRAPIEAAAQGIELSPDDWAIRCNLVTVADGRMRSFTAEQIPSELGRTLIARLNERLGTPRLQFYPGVSYRNLLIARGPGDATPFHTDTRTAAPHDIPDQLIADHLPSGPGSALLRQLMDESASVLAECPENAARAAAGGGLATQIWLWGQGRRPALEPFRERYGVSGAMITAVDLLRGLAALLGWKNIAVPGATGYLDTDYAAKGEYAIAALRDVDFIVVHVEATDEASHEGSVADKVEALERIDKHIVGPLHAALQTYGEYRILVSPDHPTFLKTRMHSYGDVPFALCGTGIAPDVATTYCEPAAARSATAYPRGYELMSRFLRAE